MGRRLTKSIFRAMEGQERWTLFRAIKLRKDKSCGVLHSSLFEFLWAVSRRLLWPEQGEANFPVHVAESPLLPDLVQAFALLDRILVPCSRMKWPRFVSCCYGRFIQVMGIGVPCTPFSPRLNGMPTLSQ